MSERIWPEPEEHPPLGALTLHLEHELEGRDAARVARHLEHCWTCRRQLERLEQGTYAFVDYRREVLLASLPPPPQQGGFLRRLLEAARQPRPSYVQFIFGLARASLAPQLAWIASGFAVAVLCVVCTIWFLSPPKLTAAEFLRRAHTVSSTAETRPHSVICQQVRIRRGNAVFQRATYHGAQNSAAHFSQTSGAPDPETKRALELARIDWQDPLNVDDFTAWHGSQSVRRDEVTKLPGRITLKTTVPEDLAVEAAALTVSSSDWHPVARRVEFRGQPPVEVTELAYEVRELPEGEAREVAPSALSALPGAAGGGEPHLEAKAGPSANELEEAELQLREAFHAIGADVREAPEIRRTEQGLQFRVWADSAERKQEILRAVLAIPHVAPAGEPAASSQPTEIAQTGPVYSTTPPLAKALWDYLGGLDAANNFLFGLTESYDRVLTDASGLARLAQRYSDAALDRLTPEMRARVNRIAGDHVDVIRSQSEAYLRQMSPVLDDMLQRDNTPVDVGNNDDAGCQPWQSQAPLILEDIRRLHTSFRRLFVEDQVDAPLSVTAEDLLRESARARARLSADVNHVCQEKP